MTGSSGRPNRPGGSGPTGVRPELPGDALAVRALNEAAFETDVEARIVDTIRGGSARTLSLVAESEGAIVGHILFSSVSIEGHEKLCLMGLAPMAVLPARQREGIGSALVREGLERCRNTGCHAVVVLGHPEYYPRFGFVPASRYGIGCEYDVPDEVFMLVELEPGALEGVSGRVAYHPAFSGA